VYLWQGNQRSGNPFCCIFVSTQDPREYCMGQMRWGKKTEGNINSIQYKFGMVFAFTMSKAAIADDVGKQYTHTPIQIVASVSDTNFAPLLNSQGV